MADGVMSIPASVRSERLPELPWARPLAARARAAVRRSVRCWVMELPYHAPARISKKGVSFWTVSVNITEHLVFVTLEMFNRRRILVIGGGARPLGGASMAPPAAQHPG